MSGTGRKSYATFDTAPYGEGSQRLKVPAGLPKAEKQVFLDLVTTTPASQFAPSDLPLLVRYCELAVLAERAAEGLRNAPLVTEDGRISPWATLHASAVKGLVMMSLRLKLAPQARSPKAPKTLPAPLSVYETMRLAEEDDDGAAQQS